MSISSSDAPHPIQRDTAILPTAALENFVNALLIWLENLQPGALVYGTSRSGKTQALRYVMANIVELLDVKIPVTLLSCTESNTTITTENRFYASLLDALGYGLPHAANAGVKRTRVIDLMVEEAKSVGEYRYLLLVDEAHWLSDTQLAWAMDLHNMLKLEDIRLVTILVGQEDLLKRRQQLIREQKSHLLGRFMTSTHRYAGLNGQGEFVEFCRAFDQHSEWPVGSGTTFTAWFLPKAFVAGWRLEQNAVEIWKVIAEGRERQRLPSDGELPMQAIMAMVRWLLQALRKEDNAELVLHRRTIETAYEMSAAEQLANHFQSQPKRSPRP